MKKYFKYSAAVLAAGMLISGSAIALTNKPTPLNNQVILSNPSRTQIQNGNSITYTESAEYRGSSKSNAFFKIVKDAVNGDRLYGWGKNTDGLLGLGSTSANIATPTLVDSISGKGTISYLVEGNTSAFVVLNETQIWAAGKNSVGEHGSGSATVGTSSSVFKKTYDFSSKGKITSITASGASVAVVINNAQLYTWGLNNNGQLGLGDYANYTSPTLVTALTGTLGNLVSGSATMAIKTTESGIDKVYTWGLNNSGQLGIGTRGGNKNTPQLLTFTFVGEIYNYFATLDTFFVATRLNGINTLYAWGWTSNGLVGDGTSGYYETPTDVKWFPTEEVVNIIGHESVSTFLTGSGTVYVSGLGSYNGIGKNTYFFEKELIPATSQIVGGNKSGGTLAITKEGIYAWGPNSNGGYGNGTTITSSYPTITNPFAAPSILTPTGKGFDSLEAAANNIYYEEVFNEDLFKTYFDTSSFPAKTIFYVNTQPVFNSELNNVEFTVTADLSFASPDGNRVLTPTIFTATLQQYVPVTDWALIIGLSVGIPLGLILIGLIIWYVKRRANNGGSSRGTGRAGEWFASVKDKLDFSNMFANMGNRSQRSHSRRR